MPVFFLQEINATTKLGIWKIEEDEAFFKQRVSSHRIVTHPHKQLQHLAGRFLLKYLYPDFPSHLIQIADTRKPFLPDETYHFSISHCGDYAAAIVSKDHRVGIDIEIPTEKVIRIGDKFISETERNMLQPATTVDYTKIWSAKEAVFKWYSKGEVDFRKHIVIQSLDAAQQAFKCVFTKTGSAINIGLAGFENFCLAFIATRDKF